MADQARLAALDLLRAVRADSAYANLRLPRALTERRLSGRDAAFATELGYGAVRSTGVLDLVLGRCVDRPLDELDGPVLDLLRLGSYQLLRTRVPAHAAVASTVELSRSSGAGRAGGLINAVLRRVSGADWDEWVDVLAQGRPPLEALALRHAHPAWIASAFAQALDGDEAELEAALIADDARPLTHLVAYPGLDRDRLGGTPGPWSAYAVRLDGGDPGAIAEVRDHRAAVQDEGSQLCALALAAAPLAGPDRRWLDLCAGPGGKAALLAACAQGRGATVTANELRSHRAALVEQATGRWNVSVRTGDARAITEDGWDRILLDAPCTGLGALRRRPEARWRRQPGDVPELVALQKELLGVALRLVRPGGLVAYVTCSPHPEETLGVVADQNLVDARPLFASVPDLGAGPTVQLWPHRHGTDAMFFALIRRDAAPSLGSQR